MRRRSFLGAIGGGISIAFGQQSEKPILNENKEKIRDILSRGTSDTIVRMDPISVLSVEEEHFVFSNLKEIIKDSQDIDNLIRLLGSIGLDIDVLSDGDELEKILKLQTNSEICRYLATKSPSFAYASYSVYRESPEDDLIFERAREYLLDHLINDRGILDSKVLGILLRFDSFAKSSVGHDYLFTKIANILGKELKKEVNKDRKAEVLSMYGASTYSIKVVFNLFDRFKENAKASLIIRVVFDYLFEDLSSTNLEVILNHIVEINSTLPEGEDKLYILDKFNLIMESKPFEAIYNYKKYSRLSKANDIFHKAIDTAFRDDPSVLYGSLINLQRNFEKGKAYPKNFDIEGMILKSGDSIK